MDEQVKELQIKELRESTGMSQGQFAEYFDIKVRTLQGWEMGKRPQTGMVSMMERILKQDEYIQELEAKLKRYEDCQ